MTIDTPQWFKSSYSSNGGNCVEVATNTAPQGIVPVRDSKVSAGPVVTVGASAFAAFIAHVKEG
ncbi:DUF397 domain-containing protein [Streptomyces termitum]|uniref:DUF397 domain-containing protein n=1 Tax=Streptomyces termitum TaxID=67368 RepID=A0A918W4Y8_9ACTN|nr:DUF397 domain-containing protein [Streptomyces termitum]GHA69428.1 hypothetical protein GCM10010305_09490 [Streptomyces termitum]